MARNRERAKQRQAERKAARQAAGDTGSVPEAQVRAQAPPEDLGQSGRTLEDAPPTGELEDEVYLEDEELDAAALADGGEGEPPSGPRGIRGGDRPPAPGEPAEHHDRGRVVGFLVAVWAELQRVQWPNRSQLTSLTGITLAFVLIVGGYLGLLDAIFSRIIQAIL